MKTCPKSERPILTEAQKEKCAEHHIVAEWRCAHPGNFEFQVDPETGRKTKYVSTAESQWIFEVYLSVQIGPPPRREYLNQDSPFIQAYLENFIPYIQEGGFNEGDSVEFIDPIECYNDTIYAVFMDGETEDDETGRIHSCPKELGRFPSWELAKLFHDNCPFDTWIGRTLPVQF